MKCLIIQSDGEHKGQDGWVPNWYLRECYSIQHAFKINGIECDIWGKRHSNFEIMPDFNSYDIIFCIENYETEWIPDFSIYKRPIKIQWVIDLHYQGAAAYSKISNYCDIVLHSTKCLIHDYSKTLNKSNHIWFPNGADDRYFKMGKIPRTIDFGFVGSKNESRKDFIEKLEKDAGLYYKFVTGIDMINLVSSFKVHFNKNISTDINYRTFETISLGVCLLTNYDPDLELLGFKDGYNCLIYNNYDEAIIKSKEALLSGAWLEIGKNAFELSKNHSYVNRIKSLLKILDKGYSNVHSI